MVRAALRQTVGRGFNPRQTPLKGWALHIPCTINRNHPDTSGEHVLNNPIRIRTPDPTSKPNPHQRNEHIRRNLELQECPYGPMVSPLPPQPLPLSRVPRASLHPPFSKTGCVSSPPLSTLTDSVEHCDVDGEGTVHCTMVPL